jgi:signal transduction histidine kinase
MHAADAEALRREWTMRRQWAGFSAWFAPVDMQEQGDTCRLLYTAGDCQPLSVWGHGKVEIAEALQRFQAAAEALAALHGSGWLHMRGCPDDWVLVDGRLRLAGLGWAMPITQASAQPDWLADTVRLPWLAPELSGRLGAQPDTRTDLYTLGALMYAHLTGTPPLQGADGMETLHAILARAPQPAHLVRPDIPLPLSDLLGSLLAKHPQDRPASAEALIAQLRGLDAVAAPRPAPAPARLQFAKRLVGRTSALDQLKGAWKAAREGSSQIVLLQGQQGVGKSALAQALGALATAEGGHFLAGKFTQYNRASPYIGLYEALNSALNRLLTLDEASLQVKRQAIAAALGDNAAALAQFLPGLTWLLGMHLRGTHEEGSETVNRRLKRAFRAFIAEFASAERPLVLVLEDVQWAAGPSFQLLQTLLEQGGLPHLLLILSYRAEEQDGQQDWLEFQAGLPQEVACTHLHLQALDTTECAHWLAETLELSVAEVTALARVLHQKTGGNPLFLRELLGRIHRAQLLYRAADSGQWAWRLEAIQGIETAGGSAALIAEQLRQIPAAEADILFKAAVLGGEIEPEKLVLYFGFTLRVLQESLDGAVDQGILLPPAEPGLPYRFAHELLQKAAYELADPVARSAAHHTIALAGMGGNSAAAMDAHALLYHGQQCLDRLDSPDLRRRFAALSLDAVQKDRAAVAFERAYATLVTAKQQLGGLSDLRAMELRGSIDLALYEAMAFTGRDAAADQLHQEALRTYADQLLHVRLHLAKARVHIARSELTETLHSCKAGLALVGIRLPVKGSTLGVVIEFLRTQWVLRGKRADDLKDLPTWDSPIAEFLSELMYLSLHPAYVQDPTLFAILSLKALQMTVRKGVGRNAYLGFSTYSSFLAVGFDDFKRAWAYAHVGDRIADRLGNRFFMVYAARAFSQTYGQPLRNAFQWSELAHQKADHASLLREASEPLPLDAMARYHAGVPLVEVEKTISGYLVYIQKAGTQHLYDSVLVAMIGIRRLRGMALDDLRDIHGQALDAARLHGILYDTNYLTIRAYHQLFELQRLALLGDIEAAAAMLPDLRAIMHSVAGAFTMTEIIFTEAWVMGLLGRSRRGVAGLRARMRCARLLRKIRKWAASAPDNFQHKVLLLEGLLETDAPKAIARLEDAARAATQSEFTMHAALATELAGMRCLTAGMEDKAVACLQAAEAMYAAWGATVKSQAMRLRFPAYFPPVSTRVDAGTATLSGRLDLSSLLKASRTISSEISLSGLLSRLIRIMTEYAGAERGLLLIEEDGQLLIQARSEGGNAEVFILEGSPARASDRLSQRILNVVARRHEALVLADASLSNEFADDPYVLQQRPKSILCLPILNQSQLSGILYLENNLAAGAFSHERVEVLDTLAAQAAVSLANARLYLSLEARVEERTQALQTALEGLRATQDQLVQSEKLASLGQVTAGIAHEIRNPLNFITNFSELSEELIDELVTSIKTLDSDSVSGEIKAEWIALLQDIQQNAAKIRHHGKRAEAIVRNMLMHAASGSGERQALDLNALAKEYLLLAYHGMRGTHKGFQCQLEDQLDPRVAPIQVVQQDISRALLNIFHNALQAMEEKARSAPAAYQPRLLLRTVELGHAVELHIRDNGPGIPQAIQEQIFDPFFTTKPTGKGTGLGLSLTFDLIVQGHGGQIRVESEPDAWTEFILTLPRR